MWKFTWNFLKEYIGEFILMVIVIFVLWGASLGVPKVTGEYIDTIVAGQVDISYTKVLIIAFIIIAVAEFITAFLSAYLRNKIANRLMFDIRIHLLSYVRKLPLSFFKKFDSSYLGQRISEDSWEVGAFITILIIGSVINVITVGVIYFYFFIVNISIGIKLILLLPIYLLIYHLFKNPIYKVTMSMRESINKVFGSLNNQLINIKIIKANNGHAILSSIDLIQIENLVFAYDDGRKIVDKFNYRFEKGKIYCILGENGRGKSTLTNIILGLYLDYEGKITYNSQQPTT